MSFLAVAVAPFLAALVIMGAYALTTSVPLNPDQRAVFTMEAALGVIAAVALVLLLSGTDLLARLNEFPTNLWGTISMVVQGATAFWLMTKQDKKFGLWVELPD